VQRIGELLRQLRGTGATVLIAEQNMHFALALRATRQLSTRADRLHIRIEELKANETFVSATSRL